MMASSDFLTPPGDVHLEGLRLRKDAFKSFALPLSIRTGYIGKLTIQIPWTQLRSKPVVISIDEIFVCL